MKLKSTTIEVKILVDEYDSLHCAPCKFNLGNITNICLLFDQKLSRDIEKKDTLYFRCPACLKKFPMKEVK